MVLGSVGNASTVGCAAQLGCEHPGSCKGPVAGRPLSQDRCICSARGSWLPLSFQNAGPSCYLTKLGAAQPISAESTVIAASASIAPMNTCRRGTRGGCGTLDLQGAPGGGWWHNSLGFSPQDEAGVTASLCAPYQRAARELQAPAQPGACGGTRTAQAHLPPGVAHGHDCRLQQPGVQTVSRGSATCLCAQGAAAWAVR